MVEKVYKRLKGGFRYATFKCKVFTSTCVYANGSFSNCKRSLIA